MIIVIDIVSIPIIIGTDILYRLIHNGSSYPLFIVSDVYNCICWIGQSSCGTGISNGANDDTIKVSDDVETHVWYGFGSPDAKLDWKWSSTVNLWGTADSVGK